jgi:hypothetical protein
MKNSYFLFIFFIPIVLSCKPDRNTPEVSFYYWKTTYSLSENERNCLNENNVRNIYIRYFDIDMDDQQIPFPKDPIQFNLPPTELRIIPVVYIKNIVMLNDQIDYDDLSKNIIGYIEQINKKNNINCDEIQIDCDWTLKSRDNYMKFIGLFKEFSKKILSVTIRLHQIKYFSNTGIPAVDYGVLMYYNMGTIAPDSLNSIYDREISKKYLASLRTYPLELEIALPIFSRGVHISDKKVVNLIVKSNAESFANDSNFNTSDENRIIVKNSNFKFGYYFKQNDEVKIEKIRLEDLKEMAEDLSKNMPDKPKQIIFFDLDSFNLEYYTNESQVFKEIAHYF